MLLFCRRVTFDNKYKFTLFINTNSRSVESEIDQRLTLLAAILKNEVNMNTSERNKAENSASVKSKKAITS